MAAVFGAPLTAYSAPFVCLASVGVLDGWLVDEVDAAVAGPLTAEGIETRAVPLWMRDPASSAAIAAAALELADQLPRDDR